MRKGRRVKRSSSRTYMLTIWQTVLLEKEQLHVTAFSDPFNGFEVTHPHSPLHGSALKFQSPFPTVFPISSNALTALYYHQSPNVWNFRFLSDIFWIIIFYPFLTHFEYSDEQNTSNITCSEHAIKIYSIEAQNDSLMWCLLTTFYDNMLIHGNNAPPR